MKIALTGTPGTGKTSVATALSQKGYAVTDLNKLVLDNKWDLGFDDVYQSTIADLPRLNGYVKELPDNSDLHFFEGHLAHLLDLDIAVVLRTHPDKLEQRLKDKNYGEEKVRENLEAEALAVITTEAVERYEKIYEVETTELPVEEVAELVERILKEPGFAAGYAPGRFDWLEAII